jgi:hypothetical protein
MKRLFVFFALSVIALSCSKDQVEPMDDNELITTVQLEFKPVTTMSGQTTKSFYWRDTQGDGVMDSVDPIVLDKNTTYEMKVFLLDETKKPIFDISKEIEEEADVHLFVFKSNPLSLLSTQIKDLDKNGKPIGLRSEVKSQFVAGTGTFNVILKHQPPVNGIVAKTGNEEGGSTDVDVTFPVTIK